MPACITVNRTLSALQKTPNKRELCKNVLEHLGQSSTKARYFVFHDSTRHWQNVFANTS